MIKFIRNLGIRTKVILVLVFVVVAATALVATLRASRFSEITHDQISERLLSNASATIGILDSVRLTNGIVDSDGLSQLVDETDFLNHTLGQALYGDVSFINIANAEGIIVFSNRAAYIGRTLGDLGVVEAFGYVPMNVMFEHNSAITGADKLAYISAYPLLGWTIISFFDADAVVNIGWEIFMDMVPTVGGILIASALLVFVIGRMLKPLHALAVNAKELAKGNLAVNLQANSNDEVGQVSAAFMEIVESMNSLMSEFVSSETKIREGQLNHRLDCTQSGGVYKEILDGVNGLVEELVDYMNYTNPMVVFDRDYKVTYTNPGFNSFSGLNTDSSIGMNINDIMKDNMSNRANITNCMRDGSSESFEARLALDPRRPDMFFDLFLVPVPLWSAKGDVSGLALMLTDFTDIRNSARHNEKLAIYRNEQSKKLMDSLSAAFEKGNLSLNIAKSASDDDTREIAQEFDIMQGVLQKSVGVVKGYVDEITYTLGEFSENNFNTQIKQQYIGDFGSIKNSLDSIVDSISGLVSQIQEASAGVEDGAADISDSTQNLMSSFEEQASSMSLVKDAVGILTEKTKENAEDAQNANSLSEQVQKAAAEGSEYMQDMSAAMDEIKGSSGEIAKIVSIIEGIAFQTNLLALNASVEAARAGEHGKGFAVVAEEVRSLAGRSAAAAQDTAELIAKSLGHVDAGTAKSAQTAGALQNIVDMISNIGRVVANIAAVSGEQADEIGKIQNSMEAIYNAANENAMAVQSNAAVSEELSAQASTLKGLVERFRVKNY
ncbi:MAG: methyl-accepting chemotaxis protein [Clostridiales bacterium]|jgi:methyl-accepting chemotaxis protein|nr:methyl-accepting chemotaxis protein [Clostridiales bacterium]